MGLAFVVGRANVRGPADAPYVGVRGGSRVKAAGLAVFYLRDTVERAVEPSTVLRGGDRLRLVMRGERPRYVEVRLRDGNKPPVVVFPAAGDRADLVRPGQTLSAVPELAAGRGRLVVTALFSDAPRALGAPPDDETQTVTLAIVKE